MAEVKKNTLDTFAFLVHREVDRYVHENIEAYERWVLTQSADSKSEDVANSVKDGDRKRE